MIRFLLSWLLGAPTVTLHALRLVSGHWTRAPFRAAFVVLFSLFMALVGLPMMLLWVRIAPGHFRRVMGKPKAFTIPM